jgi:hypothetical protein
MDSVPGYVEELQCCNSCTQGANNAGQGMEGEHPGLGNYKWPGTNYNYKQIGEADSGGEQVHHFDGIGDKQGDDVHLQHREPSAKCKKIKIEQIVSSFLALRH